MSWPHPRLAAFAETRTPGARRFFQARHAHLPDCSPNHPALPPQPVLHTRHRHARACRLRWRRRLQRPGLLPHDTQQPDCRCTRTRARPGPSPCAAGRSRSVRAARALDRRRPAHPHDAVGRHPADLHARPGAGQGLRPVRARLGGAVRPPAPVFLRQRRQQAGRADSVFGRHGQVPGATHQGAAGQRQVRRQDDLRPSNGTCPRTTTATSAS